MSELFIQLSQLSHGIEQLDTCGQWYIQMVAFRYEFDRPYVFKSEWVPVGNYAVPKKIGYIIDKKIVSV